MIKRILLSLLLLLPCAALAQQGNTTTIPGTGAASGTCGPLMFWVNFTNGDFYDCNAGAWNLVSGGGGGGVTSFTGDGTILSNSASTGAVTATLANTPTGTGSVVLAVSPALTGTPTAPTAATTINNTQLATTAYVTTAVANAVAGVNPAVAVLAASTANLTGTYTAVGSGIGDTFTVTATGTLSLDGIAINTIGQRVLLKNQVDGTQNGVYTATIVGAVAVSPVFTRALDYDTPSDVNNTGAIPVQSGTANTTTSWLLTSQVTSIGPAGSTLTYAQFSYNPSTVALLASPAFTGTPTAPTAAVNTNTTQLATMAALLAQIAPLTTPFITTGTNVGVSTGSLFTTTTNKANVAGIVIPFAKTSTKACYEVGATADNTSATYDIGIYTGTSGGAGVLIANFGPIAGTTFAPGTTAYHCINWTQGTVTIPAGRIWIALTTSQTVTPAVIFGAAVGHMATGLTAASITAGGTLSALTLPADANSGAGVTSASLPWLSIQ